MWSSDEAMADSFWSEAAAWVQAIGTIAAVVGAAWVAAGDVRASRRREALIQAEVERREARTALATRTAALNLAVLATAQIHDFHLLLRDEARRGRISRVSPSLGLLSTERLLTAFPIQSLGDASAMVEFSRFPAALATAAEIYANLEAAVRAADDHQHGDIFADYAAQMSRLEEATRRRLQDLGAALGLDPAEPLQRIADGAER
jgi:hypothetical protein